jgi:uracil-DNA glycosylase
MSFSVRAGTKIPPSLKNIYKEISYEYEDIGFSENGDLTPWTQQ